MQNFSITLNGNSYELKFTLRAIRRLEQNLGYSVLSSEFLTDRRIDRLVKMLWAGLLHADSTLSIEDLTDMIDNSGAEVLRTLPVVNDAFNHFWGVSEDKPSDAEPEEKKTES